MNPMSQGLSSLGAKLFHSIDLRGFLVYCTYGAVVCRHHMFGLDPGAMKFHTDAQDQVLGLWTRTFGNLGDRWHWWDTDQYAVPNLYGPITLVFRPRVFQGTMEPVVLTGTAPDAGVNWLARGIDYPILAASWDASSHYFNAPYTYAEFCTTSAFLSFAHVEQIIVEPLQFGTQRLSYWAQRAVSSIQSGVPVVERIYSDASRAAILQELANQVWASRIGLPPVPTSLLYNQWHSRLLPSKASSVTLFRKRLWDGTAMNIHAWQQQGV